MFKLIGNMSKISRSSEFIRMLAQNRLGISNTCFDCSSSDTLSVSEDGIKHICHYPQLYEQSIHCSVIFKGKLSSSDVISYGQNRFNFKGGSIHAEADAINNLQTNKRRNLISVDILVIKVRRDGKLSNSSPCVHCLKHIVDIPSTKGYKVNKVYFSNNQGEIECHKLADLVNSEQLHISSYYRNTGYNMNKWHQWRNRYNKFVNYI